MRSVWKPLTLKFACRRHAFLMRLKRLDAMKIRVKGVRLFKLFNDKTVYVYNGCRFVEVFIRREMLKSFLGSFVSTKLGTSKIHSKTHRNKRGRMKAGKRKKK